MTTMTTSSPTQAQRTIVSPDDQKVTFVELFFDLVFVFAVTQIVGLLHVQLDWVGAGRALVVFWLVWWAWTQFTWTLNSADTTHPVIELATLLATGVAFFMAVAVPGAFGDRAAWFAVPYVLVRVIGLVLHKRVAAIAHPSQHAAVRRFAIVSSGGLVAVLAGAFAGADMRYLLWGMAIFLDLIAAAIGGESEGWNLHPEHFGERHGLIVIIALGESLIVAAGGVATGAWTGSLLAVGIMAVAVTCAFWWSYFPHAKPLLDHALEAQRGAAQSTLARDAYSLLHFPMLCGVIAFAVAVDESVAHPADSLALEARIALAASVVLFLGGMAAALRRATGRWPVFRIVTAAVTALIILVAALPPLASVGIAFSGIALIAATEHLHGA
jgi:low temperature requirement protein LtrA